MAHFYRFFAIFLSLLLLMLVARHGIFLLVEHHAFTTMPPGKLVPEAFGVPSRQIILNSDGRLLRGSFVQAPDRRAAAVLIFHGDAESISDWAGIQASLYERGVASLVFDYSGYGASTGRPTVRHLHQDGLIAHQQFMALTRQANHHYLLGFSLGCAVLLDVLPDLHPAPDGIVIASGFASAREAVVAVGVVPNWLARLLPDVWDNEARMGLVRVPALIVHSRADEELDWRQAVRLSEATTSPHRLVMLDGLAHDAAITPKEQDRFWAPIFAFLRSGDLGNIGMTGTLPDNRQQ
ncbi:alpha/beta hydrolase [Neisseriaceae bacterium JH1-16]|nr:alpha/beta hydrolase [Neisseriaceae bacterium JH1-16]